MRSLLDEMLDNWNSPARVISEQHDTGKITVEGADDAIRSQLAAITGTWDAAEYGISREEVERRIAEADTPERRAEILKDLQARAVQRAGLDTSNGRVNAMFAGRPAWHGLGVVVDKAATSAEAITLAGLDWKVEKVRYSYDFNGQRKESPDAFAIVRADTGAHLGTVGSKYAAVQNADGFSFLDGVLAEHGARYESAGSVFGGRRVWMLAHMPEQRFTVNGDDATEPYVLFTNCHDGSGAAYCLPTAVRTECANTLRIALRDKKSGLSIRHQGNVKGKIDAARTELGLAVQSFGEYREAAEQMVKTPCEVRAYAGAVLDTVLTVTEAKGLDPLSAMLAETEAERELARKSRDREAEQRRNTLEDILKRYESERCRPRGTLWAAFNAVTEHADHSNGRRKSRNEETRLSRRFDSILTGDADGMKQAAYQQAVALMSN